MFLIALTLIATEPPPQPMTVDIVRDAITDEVRAYATARDDGNRLVVSCEPSKYDGARVSFHARRWLARGHILSGRRAVIYRFDAQRPRRMLWEIEDRHGTLSSGRRVNAFLRDLAASDRLVIRTRDIENRRIDLILRLKDTAPAIQQTLAACAEGS